MNLSHNSFTDTIKRELFGEVTVHERPDGLIAVDTPFQYADGDHFQIYLKPLAAGLRLSDMGATLMHLSYDTDIDTLREGTRAKVFEGILATMGIAESDGEFYLDSEAEKLGESLFRFGQALTQLHDLNFLNRVRVESTFYEDLTKQLERIVGAERIRRDYIVPGVESAADYPVDYFIEGGQRPVYLFGVPGKDKARLATIILERLLRAGTDFDSLIVFADSANIPRSDLARLMNTGGEMVASLTAAEDLARKIHRKVG